MAINWNKKEDNINNIAVDSGAGSELVLKMLMEISREIGGLSSSVKTLFVQINRMENDFLREITRLKKVG